MDKTLLLTTRWTSSQHLLPPTGASTTGLQAHRLVFTADTWGPFHKTLQIRKLQINSYGQILTVYLLIISKIQ